MSRWLQQLQFVGVCVVYCSMPVCRWVDTPACLCPDLFGMHAPPSSPYPCPCFKKPSGTSDRWAQCPSLNMCGMLSLSFQHGCFLLEKKDCLICFCSSFVIDKPFGRIPSKEHWVLEDGLYNMWPGFRGRKIHTTFSGLLFRERDRNPTASSVLTRCWTSVCVCEAWVLCWYVSGMEVFKVSSLSQPVLWHVCVGMNVNTSENAACVGV